GELRRGAQILVVGVELQLELQRLGEVLDGGDVGERLLQAPIEEPLEGVALDCHEIGKRERLLDVRERVPIPDASGQRITPRWVRSAWTRRSAAQPWPARSRSSRAEARRIDIEGRRGRTGGARQPAMLEHAWVVHNPRDDQPTGTRGPEPLPDGPEAVGQGK